MNHWQFLDGQLRRMTFRIFVGLTALAAALGSVIVLSFHTPPEPNQNTLWLAIGTIIGWAGCVVTSQFGDTRRQKDQNDADQI